MAYCLSSCRVYDSVREKRVLSPHLKNPNNAHYPHNHHRSSSSSYFSVLVRSAVYCSSNIAFFVCVCVCVYVKRMSKWLRMGMKAAGFLIFIHYYLIIYCILALALAIYANSYSIIRNAFFQLRTHAFIFTTYFFPKISLRTAVVVMHAL